MKIRYLSDLHLEFSKHRPGYLRPVGEDLVVLAGDVDSGADGIEWAKRAFAGRPVVYTLGNHEPRGRQFEHTLDEARQAADGSNVHLLENDAIRIDGLKVLGCTLWTDFRVAEPFGISQTDAMEVCRQCADFQEIRVGKRRFDPRDALQRHEASVDWLQGRLREATDKVLVVSHHPPSTDIRNPGWPIDGQAARFYSDLSRLMDGRRIHAWISGHTHYNGSAQSGDQAHPVPMYTNQHGYPWDLCPGFKWDCCMEVECRPELAEASA